MVSRHSPGYDAAHKRAIRLAAKLFRQRFPDEWRQLLDEQLARRDTGGEG